MASISGVIITLNEEEKVADCIRSAFKVCDEVIVVDSHSQDRTVAICEEEGARVIVNDWPGDGPQRNHGARFANNDWILVLDADERVEEDAAQFINALALESPGRAYSFRRRNMVGSRWVKAAGFYPDEVSRLYNRTQCHYNHKMSHATVVSSDVVQTGTHLLHFTYSGLEDWVKRAVSLAREDAIALHARGIQTTRFSPWLHATSALFRKLVLKGGLLQGQDGMNVAVTTALHAWLKYSELHELNTADARH